MAENRTAMLYCIHFLTALRHNDTLSAFLVLWCRARDLIRHHNGDSGRQNASKGVFLPSLFSL